MRGYGMILGVLGLCGVGCAAAPNDKLVPVGAGRHLLGDRSTATLKSEGVRITVDGGGWRGDPLNLDDFLTTIAVTLENRSGQPVVVRYEDFVLVGASGRRFPAVPPQSLPGGRGLPVAVTPRFVAQGFQVAPALARLYVGLPAGAAPQVAMSGDRARGEPFWQSHGKQQLPTSAMREQGLPEGVLADGGRLSGFLYFEDVRLLEKGVTFAASLATTSGATLAVVKVPFAVRMAQR